MGGTRPDWNGYPGVKFNTTFRDSNAKLGTNLELDTHPNPNTKPDTDTNSDLHTNT
jgi:hypothetical protein